MPRQSQGPRLSDRPNEHGCYEILWTENGRSKRRSTGERNRARAQRRFVEILREAEREADENGLTVSAAIDAYIAEHIEPNVVAKATALQGLAHVRAHFGDLAVARITPEDVADYAKQRRAGRVGWIDEAGRQRGMRKAGDARIRQDLVILTAALNHCVKRNKRLPVKDMPHIELPPAPEARDRWLTDEETERLLSAALGDNPARLPRVYRFIAIARFAAARKEAIETLTWFQVDLERRKIHFNPSGRAQTRKRRAIVPISSRLYPILVRAKAEAINGHVLDSPNGIATAFAAAAIRAGFYDLRPIEDDPAADRRRRVRIDGRYYRKVATISPHVLRHTWATRAAQSGVDLWKIAGVLGDTIKTVTDTYLHHCPEHLRDAVDHEMSISMPDIAAGES